MAARIIAFWFDGIVTGGLDNGVSDGCQTVAWSA